MNPSLYSQPALIAIGATLGALLRWQLGLRFNPLFAQFAFGTWLANLLGCLLAAGFGFRASRIARRTGSLERTPTNSDEQEKQ